MCHHRTLSPISLSLTHTYECAVIRFTLSSKPGGDVTYSPTFIDLKGQSYEPFLQEESVSTLSSPLDHSHCYRSFTFEPAMSPLLLHSLVGTVYNIDAEK